MKTSFLSAVFALVLSIVATAAEPAYKSYTNSRFGFKISYPATLVAAAEPTNGGGRRFDSKNGEFSLATFGHFLNGNTLESMWAEELQELGSSITYKRKTDEWFVVSGVKDGTEFYHKTYVKEGNYASFHITYPHAKAKQYDPVVEKIAKSFVPFLKGDYDRAPKE